MNHQNQRISYIDRLKGFTILAVVIGHIYLLCYKHTDALMFRGVAAFEMYLFLFLSGVVINTPPGIKKAGQRAIRYLMPSIIIGTIFSLLVQGTSNIDDWGAYLFRRIYWLASGYWYLVALTFFNMSLLLHRLNTKRSFVIDVAIALFWYAVFLCLWKKGGDVGAALCMEHCTCFYPFFMLGHLLRKYDKLDCLFSNNGLFSVSMIAGFLLFFFQTGNHLADNIINRFVIPCCAIFVLAHVFHVRNDKQTYAERLFSFYGKNSLDIYLWHFVILNYINLTMVYDWTFSSSNLYLEILLAILLSLIVATTCVYWGKFIKYSSWIKNVVYGELSKKIH